MKYIVGDFESYDCDCCWEFDVQPAYPLVVCVGHTYAGGRSKPLMLERHLCGCCVLSEWQQFLCKLSVFERADYMEEGLSKAKPREGQFPVA